MPSLLGSSRFTTTLGSSLSFSALDSIGDGALLRRVGTKVGREKDSSCYQKEAVTHNMISINCSCFFSCSCSRSVSDFNLGHVKIKKDVAS